MASEVYSVVPGHITTRWTEDVDPQSPLPEYPRPQMVRKSWQSLNGLWDYAITQKENSKPNVFSKKILVPYPIESALSGVKRSLRPEEQLWYHRTFILNPAWGGGRVLLHFGAVDWSCQIFVNGQLTGEHQGGYDPFTCDITQWVAEGENQILVSVWDPSDSQPIQRGKQVLKPGFIWYTAISGIWQTVWLEHVPETYIESIKITPNLDQSCVTINNCVRGSAVDLILKVSVIDEGESVFEVDTKPNQPLTIPIDQSKLWSPDSPHLYDLKLSLIKDGAETDRVESYFGMRKFSLDKDHHGHLRFCLNNKPLFLYGPLDQGYWPDGLYTAPTDSAMHWEIRFLKEAGFNMLRKHIKVEPARYYYHCDKIGLIVWQDMVSGGISPKPIWFIFSQRLKKLRDDRFYRRLGRGSKKNRDQFKLEYRRMIDALHNVVSIAIWCPFNEGWGQFDAAKIADWTKDYDPTRLVDHASGWFDQGGGDFKSEHHYFKPLPEPEPELERGWILSEFGGYNLKIVGHTWENKKSFGYKKMDDIDTLTDNYLDLLFNQLKPWIKAGLSAAVYTQTTDVEVELNGFLTYDREVVKMDMDVVKEAHTQLIQLRSP